MNETIVAKGLAKHLQEIYPNKLWGSDEIIVKNKTQTLEHGYTGGCATLLWDGGPRDKYDSPWAYDTDRKLVDWVQEKYGSEYWLEAYSSWMICINKDKTGGK
jgi:hypothetical protein